MRSRRPRNWRLPLHDSHATTGAVTTAVAVLGISSAAGSSCREDPSQCGGFVMPCSLVGVNPVYHPRGVAEMMVLVRYFD